jgi:hypothetical protein
MDHRGFDTLARAAANSGSRRGILRGVAGTLALLTLGRRVPGAAAQTGYLGPGEACYDDSQCGNTKYSAMFCDSNGFDYDGPLNCCTYDNGYCYSDEGCCGSLTCVQGSCIDTTMRGLPLQAQCQYDAQCLNAGSGVICADNGGFVPACCQVGGYPCFEDLDCCMPNNCNAGICG